MIPQDAVLLYQKRLDEVVKGNAFVMDNLPEHRIFYLELYVHGEDPSGIAAYYPCVRINGDTGNNYSLVSVSATAASMVITDVAAQSYFQLGSAMSPNEAAHMTSVITGQQNASGKQLMHTESDTNGSGSGDSHWATGSWNSGNAVHTITVFDFLSGGFGVGTIVKLYGVK